MSDIQLLFAKSLMHMQLPRTRGILSLRKSFRSGDSQKVDKDDIAIPTHEDYHEKRHCRKSEKPFLDFPDADAKQKPCSRLHINRQNRAEHFSLCPSENFQSLDSSLEKEAKLLEKTAFAAESLRVASLGPWSSSNLIITKKFEFFEKARKDQHICFFRIQNSSMELLAYSISSRTKGSNAFYEISPDRGYVPPGHSLEVSIKYSGSEFTMEQIEGDKIIVTCFCAAHETQRLVDFIHPTGNFESSSNLIPLKEFVKDPCSLLGSKQGMHQSPIMKHLENEPKALKARRRLKKLQARNNGERLFDRIQATAEYSRKELEKCQRQAHGLRLILSLISYAGFLYSISNAFYYATYGRPAVKPVELENSWARVLKNTKNWMEASAEFCVGTLATLIWSTHPLVIHLAELIAQYF